MLFIIPNNGINLPNNISADDIAAAFNECVISQIEIKVNGINEPPKMEQNWKQIFCFKQYYKLFLKFVNN